MLPTIVSPCATVRGTARASRVHSTYAPDGTGVVSVSSSSFGAVGFALSVQPSNTSARTARRRGVPFIGPFGTREQRATVLSCGQRIYECGEQTASGRTPRLRHWNDGLV